MWEVHRVPPKYQGMPSRHRYTCSYCGYQYEDDIGNLALPKCLKCGTENVVDRYYTGTKETVPKTK